MALNLVSYIFERLLQDKVVHYLKTLSKYSLYKNFSPHDIVKHLLNFDLTEELSDKKKKK